MIRAKEVTNEISDKVKDYLYHAIINEQGILLPIAGTLTHSIVIYEQDKAIGLSTLHRYKNTYLLTLYVHPSRQGEGIGTKALEEIIAVAKRENFENITASVERKSASEHLLQKTGFKKLEDLSYNSNYQLNPTV